jgi:hypothetical protein
VEEPYPLRTKLKPPQWKHRGGGNRCPVLLPESFRASGLQSVRSSGRQIVRYSDHWRSRSGAAIALQLVA